MHEPRHNSCSSHHGEREDHSLPMHSHMVTSQAVLETRLSSKGEEWLHVYKALLTIEYLIKCGHASCAILAKRDLLDIIGRLEGFEYISPPPAMKDHGVNIRMRAKVVKALIEDNDQQGSRVRQLTHITSLSSSNTPYQEATSQATTTSSESRRFKSSVSAEENRKLQMDLKKLLSLDDNSKCGDCQGGVSAARPSWASINLGIFLCMKCAGIHRGLGVHISKIRSCTLDTWVPFDVDTMRRLGNKRSNEEYEALLDVGDRPSREDSIALERFIQSKYIERRWHQPPPLLPSSLPLPMASERLASNRPTMADLISLEDDDTSEGSNLRSYPTASSSSALIDLMDQIGFNPPAPSRSTVNALLMQPPDHPPLNTTSSSTATASVGAQTSCDSRQDRDKVEPVPLELQPQDIDSLLQSQPKALGGLSSAQQHSDGSIWKHQGSKKEKDPSIKIRGPPMRHY